MSYFQTICKSVMYVNNHCEVFNSKILKARVKPVIGCLEGLTLYCMNMIVKRREMMLKHNGVVCPRIAKKVKKIERSGRWIAIVVRWWWEVYSDYDF